MRWIYSFPPKEDEFRNKKKIRQILGNKGAGLYEMSLAKIQVPEGFIIPTYSCKYYLKEGIFPEGLKEQVDEALLDLEKKTKRVFGSSKNPLLLSVRSGAPVSMPGMMDTILNLGLNSKIVEEWEVDKRFLYDAYRRFISMFAKVVLSSKINFDSLMEEFKKQKGKKYDTQLNTEELKELCQIYKDELKKEAKEISEDVKENLYLSIEAVFKSWNNPRAISYRKIYSISNDLGTAVVVQRMVFGNLSFDSGTGVLFTRNPQNGKKEFFGEYLECAQGEDVVAGIRTPMSISTLKEKYPQIYKQLVKISENLEYFYKDIQDIEFTVEKSELYLLQTRSGKRTPQAAVKIAVDMVKEGLITKQEAFKRLDATYIERFLHKQIDESEDVKVLTKGLAASPGAFCGRIALDVEAAIKFREKNQPCILVRNETSPEDIEGIAAAGGVLTKRGGMTSHAAVVTRAMGKPSVVGCEDLIIDMESRTISLNEKKFKEGDFLAIDGTEGRVIEGEVKLKEPGLTEELKELLAWADDIRKLGVRANADTPKDAKVAREHGAEGIGLCRTEHMFFGKERLPIMQQMILAQTDQERQETLDKLLPFQIQDFYEIFQQMGGYPVCIRLLDPPLHEFLPKEEELKNKVQEGESQAERLLKRLYQLREQNPMLGFRGCRLGIIYSQITQMQSTAIFKAASKLIKEGKKIQVEIMVPLVADAQELKHQRKIIDETAEKIMSEESVKIDYKVGTMIEVPRACICADEIAKYADFFSFGTNDLTQTVWGISRDDAEGKFLQKYLEMKIINQNPFAILDTKGVGELMKIAIEKGKTTNPNLKIGICGEHGGEVFSIEFCHNIELDYVSASPYRVVAARFAAAKACV